MCRRTDVIGLPACASHADRFPGETSALTLIWATLEQDRMKWRGVQMDEEKRSLIVMAVKEALIPACADTADRRTVDLTVLDIYLEAA